nr:hypothetical protein [Candidatus Sigynarchaeum springense]
MFHHAKLKLLEFFMSKTENEHFSKIENLVEGIAVYFLIMFVLVRLVLKLNNVIEDMFRTILLVYMIAIGPLIHRNTPEELGIGNIKLIKEQFFNRKKPAILIAALLLIFLSVFVFPLYLQEFNLIFKLVPVIGKLNEIVSDNAPWFQIPLAIIEYVLFQIILILFLIRKDNLWVSLKSMAKPFLIQLCVVFGMSLFTLELFKVEGTVLDFLAIWYGYTFWGLMQQIPFLVYLSTRFRHGFPFKRASEVVNVTLIASFFGFMHAPQWPLVVTAFMMELFIARSFLHADTRNLFIAGVIHGFFGTLAIFFTGLYIKMDFV